MDRRDENSRTQRNRLIAIILALLPLFGGGGAYATTMISENTQQRMETAQAKVRAAEVRVEVDANRKGIVYNRLLILKVGRDISEQIAEVHGQKIQPLPTVEKELDKALAEMAGR